MVCYSQKARELRRKLVVLISSERIQQGLSLKFMLPSGFSYDGNDIKKSFVDNVVHVV